MTFIPTALSGVYIINNFNVVDERGLFVKTFNKKNFEELKLNIEIKESYFSVSKKNVIRGMHFQLPPYDHEKLVFVPKGAILDVLIDLRKNSTTFMQHMSIELSETNKRSIFIPKGVAHGFKSLIDNTITYYNVSTEYNSSADTGIHYNSIGFDWQIINPILSIRDKEFQYLDDFLNKNPF
ncbi:dTDP-4-dehydrorhamnose 3,5-epimerase family protein [Sediminibacterium sp.]|uniref:dTDP-4-dehydrorhamnose 3,5-epimerase family protein n=1 Tax=Sediminibacterium sp. TaxID=1917865 RepID=UPI00272F769E|nr:dTDP-4-dehydrorhamnose 3,5-epimerase family protein [Sediminibacterium sp.]MDP2420241.1 dTDP-4-dehydrorhamnose 3,5-epimerase family protein [Sediminibacterium sp.]